MTQNKQQSFNIGQIVYVLSDKAEAIVPAIVVEEMVIKKLDGSSVSWKVAVGPPEKKKIVASHELSGDVYTSLEEIKTVMVERLSKFVNDLVENARQRTELWYGKQAEAPHGHMDVNGKIDPASLIDSIEGRESTNQIVKVSNQEQNGEQQSFKVKAPINHGPLKLGNQNGSSKSELREKLRDLASPIEEEDSSDYSGEFIMSSDGRRIPVKYNQ